MKNILLFSLVLIFIFSCGKSQEIENTIDIHIIQNNSDNEIGIKRLEEHLILLPPNSKYETKACKMGYNLPIYSGYLISASDSLAVIYNDTLVVYHGSNEYFVLRDLRRNDAFDLDEKRINNTIQYTYTYTFTNADFMEADAIIN